jgi:hypothetical protein
MPAIICNIFYSCGCKIILQPPSSQINYLNNPDRFMISGYGSGYGNDVWKNNAAHVATCKH